MGLHKPGNLIMGILFVVFAVAGTKLLLTVTPVSKVPGATTLGRFI